MNRGFLRGASVVLALGLAVLATAAQAQVNVLNNAEFDSDLSGWEMFEGRTAEWSEEDFDGDANSGSALIGNVGLSTGNIPLVLYQCIPVQAEVEYQYGGSLNVPSDMPATTEALIFVQTFLDTDCSGVNAQVFQVSSAEVDTWAEVGATITTEVNVLSMRIGLGVFKAPGETGDAHALYDNLYLLPPENSSVVPAMSASWYNPDESGHGIMLDLISATEAWMCWFTFDDAGNPAWICAIGTVDGATITFEEAFTVEGGFFPPNFDPENIVEAPWGSIEIVFTGCNTGVLSWTTSADGFSSGEMPLERLTNLWGTVCSN